MSTFEAHPAADLFPMLGDEQLHDLAMDIKDNGLLDPLVIFDGKILDGRNRQKACEWAGVEPKTVTWVDPGCGPTSWVLSKNLHRRQLTKSQAAAVAVEAEALFAIEAKERQGKRTDLEPNFVQKIAQSDVPKSRDLAGDLLGVNRQYVSDAKKLRETAPETYEKVKAGSMNLQQAKREAKVEVAARDPWTERDKELKDALEAGRTVVLNASSDARVIGWAQPEGLIVYVDRTSPWGNPFVLNADGDRDQVCDAYAEHYLPHKPSLQSKISSLRGKGLICHCAPLRCHADALKELAG